MEEENEVLYDELSRVTLDHKKAQEKIKALEQQLQQTSVVSKIHLRWVKMIERQLLKSK